MSFLGDNPNYKSIDLDPVSSPPSSPEQGQIIYHNSSGLLVYDSVNWIKLDISRIQDFTDVDLTGGVATEDALVYDGSNWTASGIVFNNITDLNDFAGSPSSGDYLAYNGTNWIPSGISGGGGGGASEINDLSDVSITSIQDNDLLIYNSTSGAWINEKLELNDLSDVLITSPATNSALQYNGFFWTDSTATIASGESFLNLISEVNQTSHVSGIAISGLGSVYDNYFIIGTNIEAKDGTAARNIAMRFASSGSDINTNYDYTNSRRTQGSATLSTSIGNSTNLFQFFNGNNSNYQYKTVLTGYFSKVGTGATSGYPLWAGKWDVVTDSYHTQIFGRWDGDEPTDSISFRVVNGITVTQAGTVKGRFRLYGF